MNLRKKKELAARTLKVGKERIVFIHSRKGEIKEVITKQDIRDLVESGAIGVKEVKGKKKLVKKKKSPGPGKVRKKVNRRKKDYVTMTRKLRKYAREMLSRGRISKEELKEIRKRIRNRTFKSKANLKNYMEELKK